MDTSTYTLHDGERVTVRTPSAMTGGALLEVDAEWAPIETKPPVHLHPGQHEHFAVSTGELSIEMDGRVHVVGPGDEFEVPRGTVHKMWNSGTVPARARWTIRPALQTEAFFAAVDASRRHRRTRHGGTITLVGSGPILRAFRDEFRLALPAMVQRPLLAVLAGVAVLRGYPRPRPTAAPATARDRVSLAA